MTTIKISEDLKEKLKKLKHYDRETYEDVIRRLLTNEKDIKIKIKK